MPASILSLLFTKEIIKTVNLWRIEILLFIENRRQQPLPGSSNLCPANSPLTFNLRLCLSNTLITVFATDRQF